MKKVFLVFSTVALLFGACKKSGSKSGSDGNGSSGTFSVVMGSKTVGGTDKTNNAVVIIAADSASSNTLLSDIFVNMQAAGDTIGFHVPDKTGTTDIGPGSPAQYYGVFAVPGDAYLFNGVSVNVTTLTNDRIKGTFSGHLNTSLVEGMGDQADISGGSFDLPLIRP